MKKMFLLLAWMLIMSVGNITFAQSEWAEYDLPATVTSLAVTHNAIFVFASDQYYQVGFPLSPSGSTLPWAQMIVPGDGVMKAGVVTPEGIVFALRESGELYRLINGEWENLFPDQVIEGLTDIVGGRFFAWSGEYIYEYYNGFTQMPFDGTKAIAFNEDCVMVFTEAGNYSGPNSWTLSPAETVSNFYPAEAVMTSNEYVAAGNVMGSLAAWHQSPPDVCVPFTRVLTQGAITSVASANDTAWAVGYLGTKGMLFNTADMSSIYVVPDAIHQIRSNDLGVLGAVSDRRLYVRGSTAIGSAASTPVQLDLQIIPNPIKDGSLRIMSASTRQARLFDLRGQQIATLLLKSGENILNMMSLPSGAYLLEGSKFIVP